MTRKPTTVPCRRRKTTSHLVAGELGPRRARKARQHQDSCEQCRDLGADLQGLRSWAVGLGGLDALAAPEFHSVRTAVRARLQERQQQPAAGFMRPAWPVLAPLAGVLLMGAVLILGGGRRPEPQGLPPLQAARSEPVLHLSPLEDAHETLLRIQNGPDDVHRVAVSSHDPSFANARVFRVQGDRWVDPTPAPAPGQVIFYRVD